MVTTFIKLVWDNNNVGIILNNSNNVAYRQVNIELVSINKKWATWPVSFLELWTCATAISNKMYYIMHMGRWLTLWSK